MDRTTLLVLEDDAARIDGFRAAVAHGRYRDGHIGGTNYRESLAVTASVGGDVDTNCAIVGGIVSLSAGRQGIPEQWLSLMERLPYALESLG